MCCCLWLLFLIRLQIGGMKAFFQLGGVFCGLGWVPPTCGSPDHVARWPKPTIALEMGSLQVGGLGRGHIAAGWAMPRWPTACGEGKCGLWAEVPPILPEHAYLETPPPPGHQGTCCWHFGTAAPLLTPWATGLSWQDHECWACACQCSTRCCQAASVQGKGPGAHRHR